MIKSSSLRFFKALIVSAVYRWAWPSHASVAEMVYLSLPLEVQENLDLDMMIDGSNDPDQEFKDTAAHHYPNSCKTALRWLDEGKCSYEDGDYGHASYCFGVFTHCVADSFAAPHCVGKESGKDHHNFETVVDDLTPQITYLHGDLDSHMRKGFEKGKSNWEKWKKTHDKSIIQSELDMGASAAYSAIKNALK